MPESILIKFLIIFIAIISIGILLIFIIRSILEMVIYFSYKNIKKIKNKTQKLFPKKSNNYIKEDEELILKKDEIPIAHSKAKDELKRRRNEQKYQILNEDNEKNESRIVGASAPIGFWTRKIFGERIATILAQVESMKKGESTDFWKNFKEKNK